MTTCWTFKGIKPDDILAVSIFTLNNGQIMSNLICWSRKIGMQIPIQIGSSSIFTPNLQTNTWTEKLKVGAVQSPPDAVAKVNLVPATFVVLSQKGVAATLRKSKVLLREDLRNGSSKTFYYQ